MPLQTLHIGPFQAVYVGDYGSTNVLTKVAIPSTGSHKVLFSQPESFLYWANNSIQAGAVSIKADLTFLSDDPLIVNLAQGNSVDSTNQDDPGEFQKYTVLLVHPDEDADSSILIPQCYTVKNLALEYSKSAPTTVALSFVFQELNRYNPLFFKRSATALASVLGTRSPI